MRADKLIEAMKKMENLMEELSEENKEQLAETEKLKQELFDQLRMHYETAIGHPSYRIAALAMIMSVVDKSLTGVLALVAGTHENGKVVIDDKTFDEFFEDIKASVRRQIGELGQDD